MKNLTDEKVKELLEKGKTVIEIAKEYNVSRQAVYYHIEKLKEKKKKEPPKNNKSKINYNSKINWKVYNEVLVKRGEIIFDFEFFKNWKNELKEMNKNKIGSPYFFPETFIRFLLKLKSIFQIDYRTLEGIGRKILVIFVPEIKRFPDYTTIQNRFKKGRYKLEVYQREGLQDIAIDSSGLKRNKRGEYRMVQNKGRERKKYVKLHIAVNIKTKQVVAGIITEEYESDSKQMKNLLDEAEGFGKINKLLSDRAYDSEENHWEIKKRGIIDGIKMKERLDLGRVKDEIKRIRRLIKLYKRKGKDRTRLIKRLNRLNRLKKYLKDKDRWEKEIRYGDRWHVEIRYWVYKALFGEEVYSKDIEVIRNEVLMKLNLMNLFTAMINEMKSG